LTFHLRGDSDAGARKNGGSNVVDGMTLQFQPRPNSRTVKERKTMRSVAAIAGVLPSHPQCAEASRFQRVPGEGLVPEHGEVRKAIQKWSVEFVLNHRDLPDNGAPCLGILQFTQRISNLAANVHMFRARFDQTVFVAAFHANADRPHGIVIGNGEGAASLPIPMSRVEQDQKLLA